MNIESVNFDTAEVRKLLGAASADGALLYIYLKAGNLPDHAAQLLNLSEARFNCAMATLRQLGLWQEEKQQRILAGERPVYSERDVLEADSSDMEFKALRGEVERLLGRNLNTEELKILLGFIRYLGLPADVISVLICYCKDRARQRGSLRNPSLRTIEKEAYAWAEQGIDNLEEAAAFIQAQNVRNSRMSRLQNQLQIRSRKVIQTIHQGVDIEPRTTCHHKGLMALVKQTVYQFKSFQFILSGGIKLFNSMRMDKIMLNSGKLLSRRHGCAYGHFLIYLTGIAGNHR